MQPTGGFLPVPQHDTDPESDTSPNDELGLDIAAASGRLLIVNTTAGGHGDRASAPQRDFSPQSEAAYYRWRWERKPTMPELADIRETFEIHTKPRRGARGRRRVAASVVSHARAVRAHAACPVQETVPAHPGRITASRRSGCANWHFCRCLSTTRTRSRSERYCKRPAVDRQHDGGRARDRASERDPRV